jgi:transcriptional regulator with XRE-family HTH domain
MQPVRKAKGEEAYELVFGQVLRELRVEQGLTQEELAFESGYHPTYIGQLERGAKNPSLRTILCLSAVLLTPGSEVVKRVELLLEAASAR